MRRILTAFGVSAAMIGAAQAEDGFYGKYETPRYEVLRDLGGAELRRYAPHILAQVAVQGDRRGALGRGFQVLAGYIFGGNDDGASVSMTSPVTQSADGDIWTVTFMMPSEFSLDTLPAPNSAAVQFVQVPAQDMVAVLFSGRATTRALEAQTQALRDIAAAEGITTTGAPIYKFYDDPFTLPFARRNEVALVIE